MTARNELPADSVGREYRLERATDPVSAAVAVAIVREAAHWASARGIDVWSDSELRESDYAAAAAAGELILGYAGPRPAATMVLQTADALHWPEAAPGSALYLHKVAVRRQFAAQGWVSRLIAFAVAEAQRQGIRRLRLDTLPRPKLQSIYEAHGFVLLADQPVLIAGQRKIRMERVL